MKTPLHLAAFASVAVMAAPALGIDEEHAARARDLAARATAYLRAQQDSATGGWGVRPQGPQLPAITGLVVTGMLMDPEIDGTDPAVARAVEFILRHRRPSGGIYDRILPSYNTSICLSALALLDSPEARAAVRPAQDYLRGLQYSESPGVDPETDEAAQPLGREHPFYGGVGYGRHGRPDNSNLQIMLQALHDSGVKGDDPAFQRALVFLARTQMLDDINDMPYADGSRQGGFIYATSENRDQVGSGQSQAPGTVEETLDDGTVVSRLRCYGSMTYGGFKSLIYADLSRDDPRVRAAFDWIRSNYTLEENPGIGTDGYYYYLLTFARAMDAWGEPVIPVFEASADGAAPAGVVVERDWANDLIDRLAGLQEPDGSFRVLDDRWMENDPVLITAYCLIALQEALD